MPELKNDSITLSLGSNTVEQIVKQTAALFHDPRFKPADKEYFLYFSNGSLYLTDGILVILCTSLPPNFPEIAIKLPLGLVRQLKKYSLDIEIGEQYCLIKTDPEESGISLILEAEYETDNPYLKIPPLDNFYPDIGIQLDVESFANATKLLSSQVDKERKLAEIELGCEDSFELIAYSGNIKFDSEEEQETSTVHTVVNFTNGSKLTRPDQDKIRYYVNIKYLEAVAKIAKSGKASSLTMNLYANKFDVDGIPFIQFDNTYFLIPYEIADED